MERPLFLCLLYIISISNNLLAQFVYTICVIVKTKGFKIINELRGIYESGSQLS